MYTCMYVCVHVYLYVRMCTCIHVCTYVRAANPPDFGGRLLILALTSRLPALHQESPAFCDVRV